MISILIKYFWVFAAIMASFIIAPNSVAALLVLNLPWEESLYNFCLARFGGLFVIWLPNVVNGSLWPFSALRLHLIFTHLPQSRLPQFCHNPDRFIADWYAILSDIEYWPARSNSRGQDLGMSLNCPPSSTTWLHAAVPYMDVGLNRSRGNSPSS